ncbi:RNA polymerase sigma factor [Saccharothrix deserti]|uniref:RNA polymerase sigma factor n=1 Tax=Saccharothrix deserti TaxID=2593674 RepID=UPI00131D346F|nr:sigma-70 family RNA polymerase sigma factor [Saccharothrix deserti]
MTAAPESLDFESFYAESLPRVLAQALMLSANRHDAEDAVQEAYVEALRSWDRVSGYDAPVAWVHLVVRRRIWKASARWRRLSLATVELEAWRASSGNPEQVVLVKAVLTAIAALSKRRRLVLVAHCVQGLTHREIAEELGIALGTVGATIAQAREALRKSLGVTGVQEYLFDRLVPSQVLVHQIDRDLIEALLDATGAWLADRIAAHAPGRDRIRRNVSARAEKIR